MAGNLKYTPLAEDAGRMLSGSGNGRGKTWAGLTLVLLLSSCAKHVIGPTLDHGSFEPYFQRFVSDAKDFKRDIRDSINVKISFGTPTGSGGDVAGQCQWNAITGNQIVIVESVWDNLDDGGRESLVFHELGHCILNRSHDPTMIPASDTNLSADPIDIPRSLMNPTMVEGSLYRQYQSYYLTELFGN